MFAMYVCGYLSTRALGNRDLFSTYIGLMAPWVLNPHTNNMGIGVSMTSSSDAVLGSNGYTREVSKRFMCNGR